MCWKAIQGFPVALIRKARGIEKLSGTTSAQYLQILFFCRIQLQTGTRKLCILRTTACCSINRTCIDSAEIGTKYQFDLASACAITTSVQEMLPRLASVLY
eukprot:EST42392.1 Hypothetical protein SS50377_18035 [Spironucleus salmonicida]